MDDKTQLDRFKEAAHKLGCDEDEAAFDSKLKEISRKRPPKKPSQAASEPD